MSRLLSTDAAEPWSFGLGSPRPAQSDDEVVALEGAEVLKMVVILVVVVSEREEDQQLCNDGTVLCNHWLTVVVDWSCTQLLYIRLAHARSHYTVSARSGWSDHPRVVLDMLCAVLLHTCSSYLIGLHFWLERYKSCTGMTPDPSSICEGADPPD